MPHAHFHLSLNEKLSNNSTSESSEQIQSQAPDPSRSPDPSVSLRFLLNGTGRSAGPAEPQAVLEPRRHALETCEVGSGAARASVHMGCVQRNDGLFAGGKRKEQSRRRGIGRLKRSIQRKSVRSEIQVSQWLFRRVDSAAEAGEPHGPRLLTCFNLHHRVYQQILRNPRTLVMQVPSQKVIGETVM